MRLSDAGLRRRETKMLYPNHLPSPLLTEDATTRSLVRGLRNGKRVARRSINTHTNGGKNAHTRIIIAGKIVPPYLSAPIASAQATTIGNKLSGTVMNVQMRHMRAIELAKDENQDRTRATATTNQATAVSRSTRGKARPIIAL